MTKAKYDPLEAAKVHPTKVTAASPPASIPVPDPQDPRRMMDPRDPRYPAHPSQPYEARDAQGRPLDPRDPTRPLDPIDTRRVLAPSPHRKYRVLASIQLSVQGQITLLKAGTILDSAGYGENEIDKLVSCGLQLELADGPMDSEGNFVSIRDGAGRMIVDQHDPDAPRDELGRLVYDPNDPNVPRDARGRLLLDGTGYRDPMGRMTDAQGRLIDINGILIEQYQEGPVDVNGRILSTRDSSGRLLADPRDPDGPRDSQGRLIKVKVARDSRGRAIDAKGRLVADPDDPKLALDAQGRPIDPRDPNALRDAQGRLVDSAGQLIDPHARAVNPPYQTDAGRLVDPRDRAVTARTPSATDSNRDAQGRLVDPHRDEHGNLLDAGGHIIDESDQTVVLDPKAPRDAQGRLIDAKGRLIDAQGRLIK